MTCYFRHLNGVFIQAGISVTKENRRELSRIIKEVVGVDGDCSVVWRQVKKRLATDESGFVVELKSAWESRAPAKG